LALGDHLRKVHAEQALAACLSDVAQLAHISTPGLCHGWAGLLATTWHASAEASTSDLALYLPGLLIALLDHVDHADHEGLAAGRTGIALLLHTMTVETSDGWETCLLIA
jgi:hypothetical protein